jgi:hypothetical protein
MRYLIFISIVYLASLIKAYSQYYPYADNKYGMNYPIGGQSYFLRFEDTVNYPTPIKPNTPAWPWYNKYSNLVGGIPGMAYNFITFTAISDSLTGELLFFTDGWEYFDGHGDTLGNADSIVTPLMQQRWPLHWRYVGAQAAYILPFSNSRFGIMWWHYTDSVLAKGDAPNEIYYHEIERQSNKFVFTKKNISLLNNKYQLISKGMQAIRHANGEDWWIIKSSYGYKARPGGAIFYDNPLEDSLSEDSLYYITYLVKKDTILGPNLYFAGAVQSLPRRSLGFGQLNVSLDGSRLVFAEPIHKRIYITDFNRCDGSFGATRIRFTPKEDSCTNTVNSVVTKYPTPDSLVYQYGISLSPNKKFIYTSLYGYIWQYEIDEPDSALAWVNLSRECGDTVFLGNNWVTYYASNFTGIDKRIYFGNFAQGPGLTVVAHPDVKGKACNLISRKIYYGLEPYNGNIPGVFDIGNMPNYNLGADFSVCWPNLIPEEDIAQINIYPNPASGQIHVDIPLSLIGEKVVVYDASGRQVGSQICKHAKNEINIQSLPSGLYLLRVSNMAKRFYHVN